MFESADDGGDEVLALEGLEQVVVGAAAHGVDGHADVVDGGDHDHGKVGLLAADAVEEEDAVAVLHDDVGEDQVEGVVHRGVRRLAAAEGELDVISLALEGGTDHGAHVGFVVHDEDARRPARTSETARVMIHRQLHHVAARLRAIEL